MISLLRTHAGPILRFSLVGVLNTGVYYGTYLVLLVVAPYLVAHLIGWLVSMTFSFLVNCRITFRVPPTWRRYALFPLSNLPNLLATSVGVVALIEILGMSTRLAPLVAGICAIPFSYALGRVLMGARSTDAPPARSTAV